MMWRLCSSFLALALFPLAAADVPIRPGERFEFRVGWGLFAHAGAITIAADREMIEGLPHVRVITTTATRGFVRALYPFDGRVESVFDEKTGRLLAAYAQTSSNRRPTQASIVFDYGRGIASYVDALRPERSTEVRIPTGQPMDLITSLVSTRGWTIEPGEKRPISVLFDDEFYDLVVTAETVETVGTAKGRRPALRLVPRMETNPRGMFRRGGSVRVWLAQDAQKLPLRLEVSVKVGTATAILTGYQPPAPSPRRSDANPRS